MLALYIALLEWLVAIAPPPAPTTNHCRIWQEKVIICFRNASDAAENDASVAASFSSACSSIVVLIVFPFAI